MTQPLPQEILQQRIEDKFEELGERMQQYAFSNTVDDWCLINVTWPDKPK